MGHGGITRTISTCGDGKDGNGGVDGEIVNKMKDIITMTKMGSGGAHEEES